MLTVIGPRWRNEIVHALNCGKPIFPLLVAGADSMPPLEGTPAELRGLLNHQKVQLRDEKWDHDLNELVHVLETTHGFVDNQKPVALPEPEVKIEPLNESQMDTALSTLSGWQPVESMVPGDYPNSRQELRKAYRFNSFKSAIQFMQSGVGPINKMQHHPRWENQWRTVTVYLSTWDIGNKVSELDIELARTLDALYKSVTANPGKKSNAPNN
jgi:pterin-4a-carbinolamine dehydratase